MFKVLILLLGQGLIYLGYGKEAMHARKELKANGSDNFFAAVFMFTAIFWLMSLIMLVSGTARKDKLLTQLVTFGVPVIYALWCIFARRKGKQFVAEYRFLEQERLEKERREKLRILEMEMKKMQDAKKIAQAREQMQQNAVSSGNLAAFLAEAEKLERIKDIAALWGSLQIEENALTHDIGQKIEFSIRTERMYGVDPKSTKKLLADIKKLAEGNTQS